MFLVSHVKCTVRTRRRTIDHKSAILEMFGTEMIDLAAIGMIATATIGLESTETTDIGTIDTGMIDMRRVTTAIETIDTAMTDIVMIATDVMIATRHVTTVTRRGTTGMAVSRIAEAAAMRTGATPQPSRMPEMRTGASASVTETMVRHRRRLGIRGRRPTRIRPLRRPHTTRSLASRPLLGGLVQFGDRLWGEPRVLRFWTVMETRGT